MASAEKDLEALGCGEILAGIHIRPLNPAFVAGLAGALPRGVPPAPPAPTGIVTRQISLDYYQDKADRRCTIKEIRDGRLFVMICRMRERCIS